MLEKSDAGGDQTVFVSRRLYGNMFHIDVIVGVYGKSCKYDTSGQKNSVYNAFMRKPRVGEGTQQ